MMEHRQVVRRNVADATVCLLLAPDRGSAFVIAARELLQPLVGATLAMFMWPEPEKLIDKSVLRIAEALDRIANSEFVGFRVERKAPTRTGLQSHAAGRGHLAHLTAAVDLARRRVDRQLQHPEAVPAIELRGC